MKRLSVLALCAAFLVLAGCSDSDDAKPQATTTPAPATPAAPAQPAPTQQPAAPAALPNHGTVTEMMHAAGYTYMNVDTGDGQPVWVAATMMRVQKGDKVQWGDAAVMRNFASKSLHRTFDKILFVSNASVVQ